MEKIIQGYILRAVAYQENSAIIDLLTEEGIVSFKARGVFKSGSKLAAAIQLYTYGEYQLSYKNENGNKTLVAAKVKDYLRSLFSDLKVSAILALLAETIFKNPDEEDWFPIFSEIFKTLKGPFNYGTLVNIILKYNTIYAGSYLNSDNCIGCGKKKNIVVLSFAYGGFLCADCAKKYNIPYQDNDFLRYLHYVLKANYDNSSDFAIPEIIAEKMTIDFFEHLNNSSGIKFKCQEIVLDCFKIHL